MRGGFNGFVILADMRTGSNALEERLNAFAGVTCYGEVFNPVFTGRPGNEEMFSIGLAERDRDPQALIDVLRRNTEGLAGFRLFSDHDPRVIEASLRDRKTAKVVLTRSPVETYVSLKLARETGQWWLSDLKNRKAGRVRFEPVEFDGHAARYAAYLGRIRLALQISGQTAFWIDHRDLGDDAVIAGCARFLGAQEKTAGARQAGRVQHPVPLSEKVTNAAEMKAALAARDPFDADRVPDHEPQRGPNVPSFLAPRERPLLYMPVRCATDLTVGAWLDTLGGGPPEIGFTQKALRSWKRRQRAHRGFTVVAHPVVRAHAAFCRFILPTGPGSFPRIRRILVRTYGVPLPDDPAAPGYDRAAHTAAFRAFLNVLKGVLAGQTPIRVDAAWATQAAIVQGMSAFAPPDVVCRAETLADDLAGVAARAGIEDAPPVPVPAPDIPHPLADIYDDRIERAARAAYQRDYMMFGYGPWQGG